MQGSFRIKVVALGFTLAAMAVVARLFYWQVWAADRLMALAATQRESVIHLSPERGEILSSDGFPLVANKEVYLAYVSLPQLSLPPLDVAKQLAPILVPDLTEVKLATDVPRPKQQAELVRQTEEWLGERLKNPDLVWSALKHKISSDQKDQLEALGIDGLGFESESKRIYPEASMAAHLLGFAGSNEAGEDTGYFGVEGFYDLELKGRSGILRQEKDAANRPILIGEFFDQEKRDGRSLKLNLDRAVQFSVEKHLEDAMTRYGAKSGSVIVMNPKTGAIVAMASLPAYEPAYYTKYDEAAYKNPAVNELYEPGSTFKVITMAAGIEEDKVKPDTRCEICAQPFKIDKYVIRTWDGKYRADETMTDVLVHSDNVGMVFVSQKLGESFVDYLKRFGFGDKTGIDLEDEVPGHLRENWSEVDLATAAFGQGVAVSGIQMVQAVGAIANGGTMMTPQVVDAVIGSNRETDIKPQVAGQVVSKETAETVTAMMVEAVEKGEAKWAKPKGYKIAGKTGTSQIPIAGHYDQEKTIASFIGFAPADDPQFVMLTKLTEPTSSPWGSETAAPLFFRIAQDLLLYWGIPPTEAE
jgi:cell division protein FtsI/penicillin-binding protein 2